MEEEVYRHYIDTLEFKNILLALKNLLKLSKHLSAVLFPYC